MLISKKMVRMVITLEFQIGAQGLHADAGDH